MPLWPSHSCACEQHGARGDRDVEAGGDGQGMVLPTATAKHVECARDKRRGERDCYPVVTFPLVRPPETFYWESPV